MAKKSYGGVLVRGISGILVFLILLGIVNLLMASILNPVFHLIVDFLNRNVLIVVAISTIMMTGELFSVLAFPLNIFYPIFNAVGGVLWIGFFYRMFELIDSMNDANLIEIFAPFYIPVTVLVFLIIIVVGYSQVFSELVPKRYVARKKIKENIEWKDIGAEFKGAAYNLASTLKDSLKPKKKVKKKIRKRR